VLAAAGQVGGEYRLGPGDVVRITVYNNPDLTTEAQITQQGNITFPLIGEVQIGSMEKSQAEQIIARKSVEYMTSNQLKPSVDRTALDAYPNIEGYGFGLGFAVREVPGVAGVIGTPGDFHWHGATGSLDLDTVAKAIYTRQESSVLLTFGLVFIVSGLAFKLAVVPYHMWVPDVYDGAPTAITILIGTAPKLAAFAMTLRILSGALQGAAIDWQGMLIILCVLSMVLGNLIAIAQTNVKRMLAYSTIANMGYMLLGFLTANRYGFSAAMFYTVSYVLTSLASFGIVLLLSRQGFESDQLDDFKGLNQRSPWWAFIMLLVMFSLAGLPPTIGFYAKFMVIEAAINDGFVWLAVIAGVFFAGDLLFKNFGVTRYGRVVFYDYDEIEYLTDCRFRTIPKAPAGADDMSGEVWYPVGPHDVFPEEFATFLLTDPRVRDSFLAFHADLLDARWWQAMQQANRDGRQIEVLSYPESIRFRRKSARPRYAVS